MDSSEAIRLIALKAVLAARRRSPDGGVDPSYGLRRVFRWYSKTFSTPLAEVELLPIDDVLQAYWEETYEDMKDEELETERQSMLEAPEDLAARQRQEDADDLDTFLIGKDEIESRAAAAKETAIRKLEDAADALKSLVGRPITDRDTELVMTQVAKMKETPSDIQIAFADDLDLDSDPMTFGLLDPPKSKAR